MRSAIAIACGLTATAWTVWQVATFWTPHLVPFAWAYVWISDGGLFVLTIGRMAVLAAFGGHQSSRDFSIWFAGSRAIANSFALWVVYAFPPLWLALLGHVVGQTMHDSERRPRLPVRAGMWIAGAWTLVLFAWLPARSGFLSFAPRSTWMMRPPAGAMSSLPPLADWCACQQFGSWAECEATRLDERRPDATQCLSGGVDPNVLERDRYLTGVMRDLREGFGDAAVVVDPRVDPVPGLPGSPIAVVKDAAGHILLVVETVEYGVPVDPRAAWFAAAGVPEYWDLGGRWRYRGMTTERDPVPEGLQLRSEDPIVFVGPAGRAITIWLRPSEFSCAGICEPLTDS